MAAAQGQSTWPPWLRQRAGWRRRHHPANRLGKFSYTYRRPLKPATTKSEPMSGLAAAAAAVAAAPAVEATDARLSLEPPGAAAGGANSAKPGASARPDLQQEAGGSAQHQRRCTIEQPAHVGRCPSVHGTEHAHQARRS
jgi:hypothetical protein